MPLPRPQKAPALAVDECADGSGCRTTKSLPSQSELAKLSGDTGLPARNKAGLPVGLHKISVLEIIYIHLKRPEVQKIGTR